MKAGNLYILWALIGGPLICGTYVPTAALAQNEYSLNGAVPVTQEAAQGNANIIPQGDFDSEQDVSLFGDEPEPPQEQVTEPPVVSPMHSSQTAVQGEANSKPVPLKQALPSAPRQVYPALPQPASPPAQAPVVSQVPPKVHPATTAESKPESFYGPLSTDGSIAPVKLRDPLTANQFSGVPPLPGSRRNLARGQAPEFYNVEAGDTLFDICSQVIDDGNYWPRVWALNAEIKNPHFIYPGMRLAFYPGDAANPPYMDIVQEDDMVPVDKTNISEAELIAQVQDVPLSLPKTDANVAVSAQEPIEVVGPEGVGEDSLVSELFEMAGGVYTYNGSTVTLPAFVFPEEKEPVGEVLGGVRGETLAGEDIAIAIESSSNLPPGARYTALRPRGEVVHPMSGERLGYRYDFVGNVQIESKADEDKFFARVTQSFLGVKPGDILVGFLSTKRAYDARAVTHGGVVDATIFDMGHYSQKFGGDGSLVYIDRGGLSPGSLYSIFQKSFQHLFERDAESTPNEVGKPIGLVQVIESSNKYAVGIVLKSASEIRVGDRLTAK